MIIEERKISLNWRKLESSYAYANRKYFVEEPRVISASMTAVNIMLSHGEEQKVLMPSILGVSPNSPDWDKILSNYWFSYREEIGTVGKDLNLNIMYDINDMSKKEYIAAINKTLGEKSKLETDTDLKNYIVGQRNKAYSNFQLAVKNANKISSSDARSKAIDAAYRVKWQTISDIEHSIYKVGKPENVVDFMLYLYCLNYSHVANEYSLVSKSPNIRFYLQDSTEIEKLKKLKSEIKKSRYKLYLDLIKDPVKVENVLYAMGKGDKVSSNDEDNIILLDELSQDDTVKFISVASDKNLKVKGEIEKYITFGILNRFPNSQVITDGVDHSIIIGNSIDEAVSYFSNKVNEGNVSEYRAKYKSLPKN